MHIYFKHMGNIHQDSILYQQNKFKNLNNAEYVLWQEKNQTRNQTIKKEKKSLKSLGN